jgi:polyhydroxybutyrate depolymerase
MRTPTLDVMHALPYDGLLRRFLVHSPPDRGAAPLPAVVVLHGAGGTPAWTLDETGWADKADKEGFLVVLPEGLRPDPTKPPSFLENAPVWNDGSQSLALAASEADDLGFIDAVLDAVQKSYAVDRRRIYATGFSNGASMVFRLGAERACRFAALAPVAGYCWLAYPRPERPTPTLFLVGDKDPLFPLEGGEVTSPWTGRRVLRPSLAETLSRRGNVELTVRIIHGLGHHWPGGRGQLSRRLAGPPSDRLIANDVIWSFFQRHSIPQGDATL